MVSLESGKRDFSSVSVVVSHLNSARTLERCLRSLLQQEYRRELFEVIVVDGGSTDGSVSICKRLELEFANLCFLEAPGCSEAEGQVLGVESSRGEVIMFTNSDIYVPRDWTQRHLEWLDKGYDLVGGKVFWGGDKYALTWNVLPPAEPQYVQQPGIGLGFSNCSVRKRKLLDAGGIMNLKSQHDTEFALRMVRLGAKLVLDPEIEVFHDHPFKSLGGSFKRSFGYALNHVIVFRAIRGRSAYGPGTVSVAFMRSMLMELALINGARVHRLLSQRAAENGISVGLLEFLVIRILAKLVGLVLGMLKGAMLRNVALSSVSDVHAFNMQRTKPPTLTPAE